MKCCFQQLILGVGYKHRMGVAYQCVKLNNALLLVCLHAPAVRIYHELEIQ